ncbi:hypothetical protein ['Camptotheca acuminata' phytoplasma]|uniref:hypothetical protein n=1 Tax='Camptotheca acuminata' phytoplasma TaxID=3239192 RepID=UPI00351A3FD8
MISLFSSFFLFVLFFFSVISFNVFLFKKYQSLDEERKIGIPLQEKKELETRIINQRNDIENLEQQNDALIRDTAMFREEQIKNQKIYKKLKVENGDLKNDDAVQQRELEHINKQVDDLNNEIKKIEASISTPHLLEKQKEIDDLKQQIKNLRNEIQRLTITILDNDTKINDLTEAKNKFQNEITNSDVIINDLTQQNTEYIILINDLTQQKIDKENEINNLKQKNRDLESNINQNTNQFQFENLFLFTAIPYNTYINKQGDTIREYSIFTNFKPTVKDYHNRTNFFEAKKLYDIIGNRLGLAAFFQFKEDGIDLKDYQTGQRVGGWPETKKNYQFIETNQPELHPIILKYDFWDFPGRFNRSNSNSQQVKDKIWDYLTFEERKEVEPYLSKVNNLNNMSSCFLNCSKGLHCGVVEYKSLYFRFRTKNLELKLTQRAIDWNNQQIKNLSNRER